MIPYKYGSGMEAQVDVLFDIGHSIRKLARKAGRTLRERKKSRRDL